MDDFNKLSLQQRNGMALEFIIAIVIAALYLILRKDKESTNAWPVWIVFAALMIALAVTGG